MTRPGCNDETYFVPAEVRGSGYTRMCAMCGAYGVSYVDGSGCHRTRPRFCPSCGAYVARIPDSYGARAIKLDAPRTPTKRCGRCGMEKPEDAFNRDGRGGRRATCAVCDSETKRARSRR